MIPSIFYGIFNGSIHTKYREMYFIDKMTHTSDIRLLIKADDMKELFLAGMHALSRETAGEFYPKKFSQDFIESIEISAIDCTSLLVDFLSDLLSLSQIHQVVFFDLNFLYFDSLNMEAEVIGMRFKEIEEEIKAVTYHEADVIFKDGLYQTNLVFDI